MFKISTWNTQIIRTIVYLVSQNTPPFSLTHVFMGQISNAVYKLDSTRIG